jgi:hypothetical protein
MTRKMSSRTSRSVAVASLLGAILLGGLMAAPVKAQANNPLDVLLVMVTALRTSVNALQVSVNLLVAPTLANVRITPPLMVGPDDYVECSMLNVSSSAHTVRIVVIGAVTPEDRTFELSPGEQNAALTQGTHGGLVYCKYTVINGTRADIRAALRIRPTSLDEPGLAVAAE